MSDYPESEKLSGVADERNAVLEFMEWANENGLQLMAVDDGRPYGVRAEGKVYEWLGIDPEKLDKERRAMLASLRDGEAQVPARGETELDRG